MVKSGCEMSLLSIRDMSKKTLRDHDRQWLFHAVRLPGMLEADEAAFLLGIHSHAVPILLAAGHLKPLGHPSEKASKKFASDYIEALSRDRKWLDQAARIIETYWVKQNRKKLKTGSAQSSSLTSLGSKLDRTVS